MNDLASHFSILIAHYYLAREKIQVILILWSECFEFKEEYQAISLSPSHTFLHSA